MVQATKQDILQKYFSHIPAFRDRQEEAIDNVLAGRNTLCLMPTGGGKSLVYQVAGLLSRKVTLVISPLIALMEQQSNRLQKQGIESICLSGSSTLQYYSTLRNFSFSDGSRFIFISPEKAAFDGYLEYILRRHRHNIGLVVLDEAHCVSQWGHSFRPAYKALPLFFDRVFGSFDWTTLLCLTATLNQKDEEEIRADFRIPCENIVKSPSLMRTNLQLHFETHPEEPAKKERLREILRQYRGDKIIVYTHRKKGKYGTKELAQEFRAEGLSCDYFDADLSEGRKDDVLKAFEDGDIQVVFATNAFGMGIDIPDIRGVIHYLVPESIEQYYQEVGRAGRDGKPSYGYLLYTQTNIRIREDMIKSGFPGESEITKACNAPPIAIKKSNPVGSFSPWLNASENTDQLMLFFTLLEHKFLKLVSKGISRINCFEVSKKVDLSVFDAFMNTSKTGSTIVLANKVNKSIPEITNSLYEWYTDHQLKLASSPIKVLFYEYPDRPTEIEIKEIAEDFQQKKKAKLAAFRQLVHLIESNADPTTGICEHLGIELSDSSVE